MPSDYDIKKGLNVIIDTFNGVVNESDLDRRDAINELNDIIAANIGNPTVIIQDNGTVLPYKKTLNFIGTTVTNDTLNNRINIAVPSVTGFVPYTGATANLNLGTNNITASNLTASGTAGSGFVSYPTQSSAPGTPSSGFRLYADNNNRLAWKGANGFVRVFDGTSNTADRTYTLPNTSGTVALVDTRVFYKKDDFWIGYGDMITASNVGSLATSVLATGNAPASWNTGIMTLTTGDTSTGLAGRRCEVSDWHVYPSTKTLTVRFSLQTLSTPTDRYSVRIGWINGLTTSFTNGIYIRYDDSVNSGRFEFVTILNGVETVVDTGVAPTGTFTDNIVTFTLNSNNTLATCSINGSAAVTSSTNLINVKGQGTGYGAVVVKSSGTNSRRVSFDYFEMTIV